MMVRLVKDNQYKVFLLKPRLRLCYKPSKGKEDNIVAKKRKTRQKSDVIYSVI